MAEPVNDFSFDPYQVEEQSLNERLKQAMLKQLRPRPSSEDIVGGFNNAFDRVAGAREEQGVYSRRKQVADDYERSLMDATRGQPESVINLLRNPATRSIGLDDLKARQKSARDMDTLRELDAYNGAGMPGAVGATGDKPSLRQVEMYMRHPDPVIQNQGKTLYELYYKPQDPTHTTARDRSGAVSSIPGAVNALVEREGATAGAKAAAEYPYKDELVDVPDGRGGVMKVPKSVALQMFGGGPKPASALPNATGALPATPAPSPAGPPASAPIPPASALPGATGAAFSPPPGMNPEEARIRAGFDRTLGTQGGNIPPQVQLQRDMERMNVLQEEAKQYPPQSREGVALRQEMQMTAHRIAKAQNAPQIAQGPGAPPQQGPAPSPMSPIGTAQAGGIPMPEPRLLPQQGPVGSRNPMQEELLKKQVESNAAAVEKWQTGLQNIPNVTKILDTIDKIGSNVYGGPLGESIAAVETGIKSTFPGLGGKASPTASNTQLLKAQSQELIGAIQKQYGTNPSNVDFRAAASRVPTGEMTPEARKELVQLMRQGLAREEATMPLIQQALQKGATLPEAQAWANKVYDAQRQQGAGNPTQAEGSAAPQPSAAGTVAPQAPQGQPPAAPPPSGGGEPPLNPAELMEREPRTPREAAAKAAMEKAKRENDPQLWEMVVGALQKGIELPQQLMSPEGGAGTVDAYKNLYRGAKQLFTSQYDPAEEQKIRAEQELKMRDPRYAAGMHFSSVANPASLVGGASAGVLRNAASAFAQSMLQPAESFGDKFNASTGPTALAATLAAAGKAIPKTVLPETTPAGYAATKDTFPNVKPTSAQLNESSRSASIDRALGVNEARKKEQIAAISDTIRKAAGIEGKEINDVVIKKGFDDTAAKYETLFHDTGKPVGVALTTTDQQALRNRFQNMLNPGTDPTQATISLNQIFNTREAPALQRLKQVLETGATGTIKVNPADLQRAWREVGSIADVNPQAAGQVRGFLEELVGKVLSPAKLKEFKELNHQWATLEDVKRVYQMGAEGKGSVSGDFAPSKLEALMGKGPNPGGVVDQAGHLVKGLRITDYNPTEVPETAYGAARNVVQSVTGPVRSALDTSAYNASPTTKHLLELLRAGLARGIPKAISTPGGTD